MRNPSGSAPPAHVKYPRQTHAESSAPKCWFVLEVFARTKNVLAKLEMAAPAAVRGRKYSGAALLLVLLVARVAAADELLESDAAALRSLAEVCAAPLPCPPCESRVPVP